MVSAWSAANGISLGQVKVDDKNNEITAIPLLINSLELSGCIVTIDAMGCQKDITQTIIEHDANYIIAIKENKKKNYQPAKQIIDYYQDRDEIINRVTRHVSEKCRIWKDWEKKLYCSQLWIYNGENVQGETCGVEVCCKDKVGKNNSRNRGIYSRGQILCNFTW